jgi:hypothetical protein
VFGRKKIVQAASRGTPWEDAKLKQFGGETETTDEVQ